MAVLDETPRRAARPALGTADEGRRVLCERLALGWRIWLPVRSAVLSLAAALGVVCFAVFAGALAFGVQPLVVISGSMEPGLPTGSVAFIRSVPAAELAVGDVVTVARPRVGGLVTHRVVTSTAVGDGVHELTLKGDANSMPDATTYTVDHAGRYVGHVPGLGNVALLLQSRGGVLLAAAAGILLIAVFLLDPRMEVRRRARRVVG
ncbi:MAG: signal peptidase I [Propionicimonas sp.]